MSTTPPPLLFAAYLLFWGHYAGMLAVAVPLALALEVRGRVPWRWDLGDRDFDRIVDLTNVLFVIAAIYLFSRDGAHGIFSLVTWLPMLLFPLILAQTYSARGAVPAGALFLSLRRQRQRPDGGHQALDLGYPYLATCLLGAAAGVQRDPWFYPILVALALPTLAGIRVRRVRRGPWLVAVIAAAGLGWGAYNGLRAVQAGFEGLVLGWLGDRMWDNMDPSRTITAIGHLGRLKLSDRIVIHVTGRAPDAPTLLLRQASYQRYAFGTWTAPGQAFEPIYPSTDDDWQWRLAAAPDASPSTTRISTYTREGRLLVPLPAATFRLDHLVAESLLRSPLGTVKSEGSPAFVLYDAYHEGVRRADSPPGDAELELPYGYREVLAHLVAEAGIEGLGLAAAARRLEAFFDANFHYSLWQPPERGRRWGRPLAHFLTTTRRGHCEYFATAGALLLRGAGIPTRYATGYAVTEYNALVGHHVVRRRHAHAWVQAWDGTGWRDLDFTPSVWAAREAERGASWWQPLGDLWARGMFAFERWRWGGEEGSDAWTLWLLPPLILALLWRLARRRRVRRPDPSGDGRREPGTDLPDTPLMALYPALSARLGERGPGETLYTWIARADVAGTGAPLPRRELAAAVALHNQLRFRAPGDDAVHRRLQDLAAELAIRLDRER